LGGVVVKSELQIDRGKHIMNSICLSQTIQERQGGSRSPSKTKKPESRPLKVLTKKPGERGGIPAP